MKDIFGTEIQVGQICAFNPPHYKGLVKGNVLKLTPKQVRVSYKPYGKQSTEDFCIYPSDLVIMAV